jgi:hypothetical protein
MAKLVAVVTIVVVASHGLEVFCLATPLIQVSRSPLLIWLKSNYLKWKQKIQSEKINIIYICMYMLQMCTKIKTKKNKKTNLNGNYLSINCQ